MRAATRASTSHGRAMVEPIKDCVWIDKVLDSLGSGEEYRKGSVQVHSSIDSAAFTPLVVYEDNQAAIAWSSNPVFESENEACR